MLLNALGDPEREHQHEIQHLILALGEYLHNHNIIKSLALFLAALRIYFTVLYISNN